MSPQERSSMMLELAKQVILQLIITRHLRRQRDINCAYLKEFSNLSNKNNFILFILILFFIIKSLPSPACFSQSTTSSLHYFITSLLHHFITSLLHHFITSLLNHPRHPGNKPRKRYQQQLSQHRADKPADNH